MVFVAGYWIVLLALGAMVSLVGVRVCSLHPSGGWCTRNVTAAAQPHPQQPQRCVKRVRPCAPCRPFRLTSVTGVVYAKCAWPGAVPSWMCLLLQVWQLVSRCVCMCGWVSVCMCVCVRVCLFFCLGFFCLFAPQAYVSLLCFCPQQPAPPIPQHSGGTCHWPTTFKGTQRPVWGTYQVLLILCYCLFIVWCDACTVFVFILCVYC